jgi:uncharacterized protein (DUF1778 family)
LCDNWTVTKAKDGRPKKRRKAVSKDQNVHIRVTAEQKETIAAAAAKRAMTVSTWLLVTALDAIKRADEGATGKG